MVHVGTTIAVLFYFWQDWLRLSHSVLTAVRTRNFSLDNNPELRLLALLVWGSIPAGIVGLLLADFFEDRFSEPATTSLALLVTAALLVYGERARTSEVPTEDIAHQTDSIRFIDSLVIGCAQALAIMPGISRSGSTIAAGLFRGLDRATATRYSFLLATPIILAAGAKQLLDMLTGEASANDESAATLVAGLLTSAVVGYMCIVVMLQWVKRRSLYGFAAYCVGFGLLSFGAVLLRG